MTWLKKIFSAIGGSSDDKGQGSETTKGSRLRNSSQRPHINDMENTSLTIAEARTQIESARGDIRTLKLRHERNRQLNAANAQVERGISRIQREIQLVRRQFNSIPKSWEDDFRA